VTTDAAMVDRQFSYTVSRSPLQDRRDDYALVQIL